MTTETFTLTVVDQSPIPEGATPGEALRNSVRLAQAAERFGYARYWVTEHHSTNSLAGSAPEILIGQIAGATSSIRVGSAGVMLSHYSALKVAEVFRMLATFFPGRIDLGIGRAPGSDQKTAQALAYPKPMADVYHTFPAQVSDVLAYLHDLTPEDHPFHGIHAQAGAVPEGLPEVWLLGSSDYSAQLAAQMGLPFAFADFFGRSEEWGPKVVALYREQFQASDFLAAPRANATLQVFCAPTDEEAEYVASSTRLLTLRRRMGHPNPRLIHPDDAIKAVQHPDLTGYVGEMTSHVIAGSPATVRAGVLAAAERYGTTDIGIAGNCFFYEHRERSYRLIAEAFGLTSAASPAPAMPVPVPEG